MVKSNLFFWKKEDSLRGQWALITGGSQGLGRALAEECARRGMNLLLVALPGSGLGDTARELAERYDVWTECYETDLTQPGSVEGLVHWVRSGGWQITCLLNNAGWGYNRRFEDSTVPENETCILLNNLALVKLTHMLLTELKRVKRAHLLNVASLAAFFPMPYMPVYAPSKAFIVNFSLALRAELAGTPVKVSVLCPNGIATNAKTRAMIASGGWAARLTCQQPEEVAAYAVEHMLRGRGVIIPGWMNRVLAGVSRIAPRGLITRVVSMYWGRTARMGLGNFSAGSAQATAH